MGPQQRETGQHNNNWIPPTDPLFGPQIRKFYKVIQLVHHLRNVTPTENKTDTKLISRMVEELAVLIKPASPTPETLELIMGNAKNWGFNTLLILQDHYKEQVEKALQIVWDDYPQNWTQALQVAQTWAKKRLPRITQEVLDHAEALIISCQNQENHNSGTKPEQTQKTTDQQLKQKETCNTSTQTTMNKLTQTKTDTEEKTKDKKQDSKLTTNMGTMTDLDREWSPIIEYPPKLTLFPKGQRSTIRAQQQKSDTPLLVLESDQNATKKTKNQLAEKDQLVGTTRSPHTPASTEEDHLPTAREHGEVDQHGPPDSIHFFDLTVKDMDPFFDVLEGSDLESDSDDNQEERPIDTPVPRNTPSTHMEDFEPDSDMPLLEEFSEDEEPLPEVQKPIRNPYQEMVPQSEIPYDPQDEQEPEGPEREFLRTFNLSFQEPGTAPTFKVIKHINTHKKMVDWSLHVHKKWLFLGDSNLAKFPPYAMEDLQIDSYPGANFRHITEVIGKASIHVTVLKVVLSLGINSRKQKPRETTIKQMQASIRAVKKQFPYSEIYIPLINFSDSLPMQEQENLREVNQHIEKNMPFLPQLDEDLFETTSDKIHWTTTTAVAMFNHWLEHLNLRLPRAS